MALLIGWRFTPSGSPVSVVLITGTNLTGIGMVTVSDGLRTMLTFSGVRRETGRLWCVLHWVHLRCHLIQQHLLSRVSHEYIDRCEDIIIPSGFRYLMVLECKTRGRQNISLICFVPLCY